MKTTALLLSLLSAGAPSFSDAEIHDHHQYEHQRPSSPDHQNNAASYQEYAGLPRATGTGFDGIRLPGINVGPDGIHLPGIHLDSDGIRLPGISLDFGMKKPEASFEGVLPWFFRQDGTPPETCRDSDLTPSQYYSLICSHFNKEEREIVPGYKVRFLCGMYGGHNGKQIAASTPERCAQLCEIDSGCTGSSWLSDKKRCILSGPLAAGFRGNTIYMHRVAETSQQADPFADDCNSKLQQCQESKASDHESVEKLVECVRQQEGHTDQLSQCRKRTMEAEQKFASQLSTCSTEKGVINGQLSACGTEKGVINNQLSECGAEKSIINNELAQCNAHRTNSNIIQVQLGDCEAERATFNSQINQCNADATKINELQTQLSQCHDQAENRFETCDRDHGKFAKVGSRMYTVWCNRYHRSSKGIFSLGGFSSLEACMLKCNEVQNCYYAIYGLNKTCQGYSEVFNSALEPPNIIVYGGQSIVRHI